MAYSTVDLVRKSLGEISEDELLTADIEEAIDETDSLIDSFISVKYALPLPIPAPKMIQRISRDITACHLYDDGIASGISESDASKIESRCKRAKETLENLRDGNQHLIDVQGKPIPGNTNSASIPYNSNNTYKHPNFFDIDSIMDWDFNSNMVDAIGDDRE